MESSGITWNTWNHLEYGITWNTWNYLEHGITMVLTVERVRELALAYDEAVELPHFHLTSFRIRNKIFATMDVEKRLVMISLTPVEQSLFVDGGAIRPVPGGWGAKGATHFEIERVRPEVFEHALRIAYRGKAPKTLAQKYED
jgi:hypothetical protein